MNPRPWSWVVLLVGCAPAPEPPSIPAPFDAEEVERILRLSPLPPLPDDPTNRFAGDERAVEFGRRLFHDPGFSRNAARSCATCHDPDQGWSDGRALSEGILELNRHTPTLWNVAYQRWFFWDGRADTLWAQALEPLENPLEHATTRLTLAHRIAATPALRGAYEGLFGPLPPLEDSTRFPAEGRPVPEDEGHEHILAPPPPGQEKTGLAPRRGHFHRPGQGFYHPHQKAWDGMTPDDQEAVTEVFVHVGKSLAAFQRSIIADSSPFDVFVEGLREGDDEKLAALGLSARRGLKLFLGRGKCVLCHSGPLFSDREFHDVRPPELDPDLPFDEGRRHAFEHLRENPFRGNGPWSDDPGGEAELKLATLPTHVHGGGEFKTPSLRNVALSPPYMHQGTFATLTDVVRFYSTREGAREKPPSSETILVPLNLDESEIADLVAFLESLTDPRPRPELGPPAERDAAER